MRDKVNAVIYAISAALFYGAGIPCSKLLLRHVEPVFMAAFMYLGAGVGVGLMYLFSHRDTTNSDSLRRRDAPYVFGMVVLDIIAPILLMAGVSMSTSSSASLLGNFEIAATALIAMSCFREPVSLRMWLAVALITLSGIILSLDGSGSFTFSHGSLLVLGAAICWGLENNCTKNISGRNTHQIVTVKGLFSGAGSLITALVLGEKVHQAIYILPAMLLGFIAYGLSIFTYIRAQKVLGAAKTSAYYAAAPFLGALLSFAVLGEELSARYAAAFLVMSAGTVVAVLDTLRHSHNHEHSHIIINSHGFRIITHTHRHDHLLNEDKHSHKHNLPKS